MYYVKSLMTFSAEVHPGFSPQININYSYVDKLRRPISR